MIHWSNELKKLKSDINNEYVKKNMRTDTTINNTGNTLILANIAHIQSTGNNQNVEIRTAGTGGLELGNKKIKNLATPTEANDGVNKAYVDGLKVLHTVNKANITFTRVNNVNATDANGEYCKLTFNNSADKTFVSNALLARKDITFYIAEGNVHIYKISDISFFESGGSRGAICIFKIPATFTAGKVNDFINKTWSEFKILTIGV